MTTLLDLEHLPQVPLDGLMVQQQDLLLPLQRTLTYNGALLTSGANTIAAATITADADGVPGSNQFALGVTVTGTGTASAGYETASNNYNFVPSTVSQVASSTGVVSSDTVAVRYLTNIAASKPAGNYSTNLDYVVTGNF